MRRVLSFHPHLLFRAQLSYQPIGQPAAKSRLWQLYFIGIAPASLL